MPRILIGESQDDLATAMTEYFSVEKYTVFQERSGWRILECLRQNQYDAIVMEIVLPGLDGISLVRDFRSAGGSTPILLMTNRHSSDEIQSGLDAGADAYVVKPFFLADLAARVRALLRRPSLRHGRILRLGDIEIDTDAGTVTKNDKPIHLHPMEFKLLQFLMSHEDQVFNAHALFERVWQKDYAQLEDTVRTHVRTLRQKIDSKGSASIITTVRGLGYKASREQPLSSTSNLVSKPIEGLVAEMTEEDHRNGNHLVQSWTDREDHS
ncbi:MAG: response regulator transcription factor [Candidatus Obscuribacterales bacterium]|nr:response regulator transcription factor [Candidatus Obscuribacterales bacterium]